MPLTSASTLTTKVETITTQTIYPAYYIRSAAEPTAYLHHTYSTENYSNDVNLGTIDYAKVCTSYLMPSRSQPPNNHYTGMETRQRQQQRRLVDR